MTKLHVEPSLGPDRDLEAGESTDLPLLDAQVDLIVRTLTSVDERASPARDEAQQVQIDAPLLGHIDRSLAGGLAEVVPVDRRSAREVRAADPKPRLCPARQHGGRVTLRSLRAIEDVGVHSQVPDTDLRSQPDGPQTKTGLARRTWDI